MSSFTYGFLDRMCQLLRNRGSLSPRKGNGNNGASSSSRKPRQ